jgi:hypothetical protein
MKLYKVVFVFFRIEEIKNISLKKFRNVNKCFAYIVARLESGNVPVCVVNVLIYKRKAEAKACQKGQQTQKYQNEQVQFPLEMKKNAFF